MAPISPSSLKRSTPSQSDDDMMDGPASKRKCVESSLPQSSQRDEQPLPNLPTRALFDDEPRQLLLRAVALALDHVGFDGASPEAMEAMCSEIDTYATRFLSQVTSSMLNARRSQSTPLDFKYALSRFDLPISSLEPHLKPPIPASKSQVQLELEPVEEQKLGSQLLLLGEELNGESDKRAKPYIPKRFPAFPSKHTYKWTEKESERETNPRKIREEAAKVARQGEEALRRLNKFSKVGKDKDIKRTAEKDPKSKERHELWEMTMGTLLTGRSAAPNGASGKDKDHSLIVNSERRHFRKGVPRKKTGTLPADTVRIDI